MAGRPEKFGALRNHLMKKAQELSETGDKELRMSFSDIEALGVSLPASAYNHHAWWSNRKFERPWTVAGFRPKDVDLRNQCLTFGYKGPFSERVKARRLAQQIADKRAEVEKYAKAQETRPKSVFARFTKDAYEKAKAELADLESAPGFADARRPYVSDNEAPHAELRCRHPIYGALQGYIRLVAGTDLTKPVDPKWGERLWGEDKK